MTSSLSENEKTPIKLLWIVVGLRGGLFLVEAGIGLWVHSLSLLAIAGHMAVDLLAISTAIVGAELNTRISPEAEDRSDRVEAWAALVNGLLLLGIAAFIVWSAISQAQVSDASLGLSILAVAALGFLVKGVSATLLYEESRHSLNIRGVFFHAITDAANSASLLLTALAILLFGWHWADTVASIFVTLLMVINALSLIWESLSLLTSNSESNHSQIAAKENI